MPRKGFEEFNYLPHRDATPKPYKGHPTSSVEITPKMDAWGKRMVYLAARKQWPRCYAMLDRLRARSLKKRKARTLEESLNLSIHNIGLPEKLAQMLDGHGYLNVRALVMEKKERLQQIKNLGPKAIEDILGALGRLGLTDGQKETH